MADRKLVGKVVDTQGQPVSGAEAWLFMSGGTSDQQTSGAAGEFTFDLSDAAQWPAGSATLRVRQAGSPLSERQTVQIPEAGSPAPQLVKIHPKEEISASAGLGFLAAMIAFLGLLGTVYLYLHGVTPGKLRDREPIAVEQTSQLSVPLADMLETAAQQAATARDSLAAAETSDAAAPGTATAPAEDPQTADGPADGGPSGESSAEGGEPADPAGGDTEDDEAEAAVEGDEAASPEQQALQAAMVGDSLKTAEEIFAELKKSRVGLLDGDKIQAIDGLFAQADAALENGAIDALGATLDRLLDQVAEERSVFLWEDSPGRLLEVMFWALAATLLRLIFNTGYYLYKSSFLKSAIPQHASFLVIIPVVAVIIAFVLTLVSVDLKMGDTAVKLDMSNVLISIVVAALIGLAPWKSWNFVHKLADLFFKTLAGYFKISSDRAAVEGDKS